LRKKILKEKKKFVCMKGGNKISASRVGSVAEILCEGIKESFKVKEKRKKNLIGGVNV
jgi:hypothetical protein